jgi:RNA polymerase sigma factor (sigma-70 family)
VTSDSAIEELIRPLTSTVLSALVRRHGLFDVCEDAVQEALLAAVAQWPKQGVPDDPRGWLLTVATRRLVDQSRSDQARRRREAVVASLLPSDHLWQPGPEAERRPAQDDTLTLLFLCCHPALSAQSQAALTLRAVCGLSTDQIARAFLTSEHAMARRISRAKQRIKASGIPFELPPKHELRSRLRVVLHVLYLMFNEGYTATSGPDLQRADLTAEAIRLTREVHRSRPEDAEVMALLALMLLNEACHPARTAPSARSTDWPLILALHERLQRVLPSPVVTLNRAVAVAMVHGPRAGLGLLEGLAADKRLAGHHRLGSTQAHLQEMAGDLAAARVSYQEAAACTTSLSERRYLEGRAARLMPGR